MTTNLNSAQTDTQAEIIAYGVGNGYSASDIQIAVEVAFIESSLGLQTSNPNSSARGLFQYTIGTWGDRHSGLGERGDQTNQIKAFFNDLDTWKGWYSDPATNSNIPPSIDLNEYIYIKHHDGNSFTDFVNAPGLSIYNNRHSELTKDTYTDAFQNVLGEHRDWLDQNTVGDLTGDAETQTLFLKSNVTESDFEKFVINLFKLEKIIDEFVADNSSELSNSEKQELNTLSSEVQHLKNDAALSYYDPLVIDLDGDGIETVAVSDSTAEFDLFADENFWTQHGWISADDGFLAHDVNQNGTIDDVSELFGDRNQRGFDELKSYDSDNNNVVDIDDVMFEELLIWQDKDQDGVSTPDELSSLTDLGIVSISLSTSQINQLDNGNIVAETSLVTLADGQERFIADVHLSVDFTV